MRGSQTAQTRFLGWKAGVFHKGYDITPQFVRGRDSFTHRLWIAAAGLSR